MTFILFDCLSKILFLTREDKSHIFKSQCNVLFIIYCSPKQKIVKIHAQKQIGKSHMIDISSYSEDMEISRCVFFRISLSTI